MIKKQTIMRSEIGSNLRGGEGDLHMLHLVEKNDTGGKVSLCAVFTIDPGCSIGVHPHIHPESEIYYILEGELLVTENGDEFLLKAGDSMYTSNGENHGVKNISDMPCKLLAIVLS